MAKQLPSMVTIGGRSLHGGQRFDVINPATGQTFASAPLCGAEDLEDAVQAAQGAQKPWSVSEKRRREAISACARIILQHQEELAHLITQEQGKPLKEARSEVAYAAEVFEQHATLPLLQADLTQGHPNRSLLLHRPFGIVGLITPWNYPIGTVAVKLAPALLAGNAVILKPSPVAPLSPLFLGRILGPALPPGILNTLSGDRELGALIASHPQIRKLSVTGSIATGRAILAEAAAEMKSVTLELGGNDPAIVLPDANPSAIAQCLLDAAWRNAGQVCSAIKRIYVHESRYDSLLDALLEAMGDYTVGNGLLEGVRLGPLTTEASHSRLSALRRDAQDAGATLHSPKRALPSEGYFASPAIVTDIDPLHSLVVEEQFGPLLPVIPFRSLEQAIDWANATNYGLSASVWTSNPSIGYEVASQLECGRVGVNGHRRAEASAPFGGFKHSGIGRELGSWGLAEMCESQVVNLFH